MQIHLNNKKEFLKINILKVTKSQKSLLHKVKNQVLCIFFLLKLDQIVQDQDKKNVKKELNRKKEKEARAEVLAYNLNSIVNMFKLN